MASRSVNKVILLGNIGKDAETKFTPGGISVSKFSLATGRRSKDQQTGEWKDITDWHNIVMWRTENVANYLLKGKQIYLEGRVETRLPTPYSWEEAVAIKPESEITDSRFPCPEAPNAHRPHPHRPHPHPRPPTISARALRTTTSRSSNHPMGSAGGLAAGDLVALAAEVPDLVADAPANQGFP